MRAGPQEPEPEPASQPQLEQTPLAAPLTPWLAGVAVLAWLLGAAIASRAGVWLGLGCTAVVLGSLVSAREWAYLRTLLHLRPSVVLAGLMAGAAMSLATRLLYLPISLAIPLIARDVVSLYGQLGGQMPWGPALLLVPVIVGEEVVWRGLVQGALARRYGMASAVPVAAGIYALATPRWAPRCWW